MLVGQGTFIGSEPILIDRYQWGSGSNHTPPDIWTVAPPFEGKRLHAFHIMSFISCADHKND